MRYYNGNYIAATSHAPTSSDAKGIHDLEAQLLHRATSSWPSTAFTAPTQGFIEFSRRFIDSNAYMGSTADYDGDYDVSDLSIPSDFSGSARLYIGHKNSITTTALYYADCAIAVVQILNSAGTSLLKSWNWSDGTDQGWENLATPTQIAGVQAVGFPESLATTAARTWGGTLSTTNNASRWGIASGTASANTGAADGVSTTYSETADGGNGTILPSPGDAVVSQTASTSYVYRETSSSTAYSAVVMRSPAYTFSGGEIIRICHCMPGFASSAMNADDTLYLGVI